MLLKIIWLKIIILVMVCITNTSQVDILGQIKIYTLHFSIVLLVGVCPCIFDEWLYEKCHNGGNTSLSFCQVVLKKKILERNLAPVCSAILWNYLRQYWKQRFYLNIICLRSCWVPLEKLWVILEYWKVKLLLNLCCIAMCIFSHNYGSNNKNLQHYILVGFNVKPYRIHNSYNTEVLR